MLRYSYDEYISGALDNYEEFKGILTEIQKDHRFIFNSGDIFFFTDYIDEILEDFPILEEFINQSWFFEDMFERDLYDIDREELPTDIQENAIKIVRYTLKKEIEQIELNIDSAEDIENARGYIINKARALAYKHKLKGIHL